MIATTHLVLGLSIFTIMASAAEFSATPTTRTDEDLDARWIFSRSNSYGSPIPPWAEGAAPGWSHCPESSESCSPDAPSLQYGTPLCNILSYFPDTLHCPRPSSYVPPVHKKPNSQNRRHYSRASFEDGHQMAKRTQPSPVPNTSPYKPTFSNYDGATQANDYMTYGLVNTVAACQAMCNNVQGCRFANTYYDVNGKGGSPLLTCSLFTSCHGVELSTNRGGQSQPNGSLNYIAQSYGWCKTL